MEFFFLRVILEGSRSTMDENSTSAIQRKNEEEPAHPAPDPE